MKRIAITGASGFISRYLIRRLVEADFEVVCLGRTTRRLEYGSYGVDVLSTAYDEDLIDILSDVDTVFHMASRRSGRDDDPLDFAENICDAVRTFDSILRAAALNGIQRIIHASSIAVYSERNQAPYKETALLTPSSAYGLMKLVVEQIGTFWSRETGVPIAHARLAQCYGHGEKSTPALMTLMNQAQSLKTLSVQNGGRYQIDEIYVDDAVTALLKIAERDFSGPMNIGSGCGYSVLQIAEAANAVFGQEGNLIIEPVAKEPPFEVKRHMDIGKAFSSLGWKPKFGLQEGLFAMKAEAIEANSTR